MYRRVIKRVLDILISVFVLVFLSWLYIIIAAVVCINLGSPVIFVQQRVGLNEKVFNIYKFRSMTNEKDANGNLLPNSKRLTKFGRFLRASSLDELPEIINILKGDMSLIGPRPWGISYLPYYTDSERHRHDVRPGLSGLAQVNGRTSATWDDRLRYDLEYVKNVSFLLDIKIVLLTVKKVFLHSDIVEAGCQGNFSDYRERQWEEGIVPKPNR